MSFIGPQKYFDFNVCILIAIILLPDIRHIEDLVIRGPENVGGLVLLGKFGLVKRHIVYAGN